MDMSFTSLLKGLRIGIIRCVLFESQEFTLPGASTARGFKRLRTVDSWNLDVTDRGSHEDILDGNAQDGYALEVGYPWD
jgi:arrestin-related trafficking adapter 4/5/7